MNNKKTIVGTAATYMRTTNEEPVFIGFHYGFDPYAKEHQEGVSGLEAMFGITLNPSKANTDGYICEKAEIAPTDIVLIEQNIWPHENITTLLLGNVEKYAKLNEKFNLAIIGIDLTKDLAASWSANEYGFAAKGEVMQNRLRELHAAILKKDVFVGYQKIHKEQISPVIIIASKMLELQEIKAEFSKQIKTP